MQSNDPFRSHASDGLNPPFEYDPYSSENYYRNSAVNLIPLEDPDDFYRPYAERSTQPDIVIQSEDNVMALPVRTRRSSATAGSSKTQPSTSATNSPARTTNRSVSGPAGPRTPGLASSKSVSALNASSYNKNGLIKERVRQFDRSRENSPGTAGTRHERPRAPSAGNATAGAVRSPPRSRLTKQRSVASPQSSVDQSHRRPLFGEVLDTGAQADGIGFGISDFVIDEHSAVGSMRQPNAMFSRSRSQSDLDASQSNSPTGDHNRSQSHDSGIPTYSTESSSAASPVSGRNSPNSKNLLTASKIPVRTRRASDISHTKAATRARAQPAASSHDAQSSKSPVLLSARRYSPPKRADQNHSLTAMVKPPLPKTSPPLRSTRNRQPVNAATAASRSKVTERFKPVSTAQISSRPKPAIPAVDIAERRARLQKNLQGAAHAKSVRQDLKNLQDGKYQSHRTKWQENEVPSEVGTEYSTSQKSATQFTVPILSLETGDASPMRHQEIDSAGADTEFEESPILAHDTSNHAPAPPTDMYNGQDTSAGAFRNSTTESPSLLKHVLSMRQSSPSIAPARTEVPDDYLTQIDDGQTIQIMLGATPKLPSHDWTPEVEQSASSPEAFHTPREDSDYTPREESGSEFGGFDGRSSIVPDDSVSMVFQRKFADMLSREPPPPMPMNAKEIARNYNNHTLTSDARSEINRVLDHYQEGHVTPEMAHGFRRQVEQLTPDLSKHDAWESPEATKQYLRNVLGNTTFTESPIDSRIDSVVKVSPTKSEPESEAGGIAIIYPPRYSNNSVGEPLERTGTLHSHSTSNATLRPPKDDIDDDTNKSYLEDISFRPAPPPKDFDRPSSHDLSRIRSIPSLPAFSSTASGLGLSMTDPDVDAPGSPLPPAPVHAPPAPPTPLKIDPTPQGAISPTSERRFAPEMFTSGLPSSPSATRGRPQQPLMADPVAQEGSRSTGASIDMSIKSRNQSPFSVARSAQGRSSQSLSTPDMDKELTQRRHRVKELVDTEHTFHQDLTIMTDIYLATASDVLQEEDKRILFGNIEQLRSFTTDFLDSLKRAAAPIYVIPRENRWNFKRGSFATSNSEATENSSSTTSATIEERIENDRRSTIGQTFCDYLPALQKVYSEWLRGANAANKRLIELQKTPAVKYWLDECIESHKDLTSAWNLDSLIVKPFQRSSKYTLLLDEILKYTQPDHPDHLHLKQAKDLVKAYNERANDVQKRSELVEQAMSKNKDPNGRIKVGKLLNRRTEKLKQQVGLSGLAEDPDYDVIAQKFGGHFFQLQVVMRDVEKYLEDVHQYVDQYVIFMDALTSNASVDAMTRYPVLESRWVNFSKAVMEMKTFALGEHTRLVRKSVIDPVQQLWRLHVGPQKMMAKRKKRLLEYIRHKNMLERGEKPDKRLETEAEQFRAVNDTLKEELPKLYALTKKLIDNCLLNFIDLQAQWQTVWTRKLGPLIDDVEPLLEIELPQALSSIQSAYHQDISEADDALAQFKLCNKMLVTEARNLKSPATTYSRDDESQKRPSTLGSGKRAMSLSSEQPGHATPNFRLSGDNMALSPLVGSLGMPEGIYQTANSSRTRAGSAMSSRGPSTPYSQQGYSGPSAYYRGEPSPGVPRLSLDSPSTRSPARNDFGNPYVLPDARLPASQASQHQPDDRFSGMFHSALPMSDSPRAESPELIRGEMQVLFLAASLFEFSIDSSRKEAGYPYLTYQAGDIFDVVAQKGELWLARNQDDASRMVGWIWEKHFARILPDN